MKYQLSKQEATTKIEHFFKENKFTNEEMRKIKRLAMKYRFSLKPYKKLFCKKCLSKLEGKIRVSKTHKTILCKNCNFKNKFKLS